MNRICFVIPYMHAGGMERVMSLLISWFHREGGKDLHLVVYGPGRELFYELPEGLPVHRPDFAFRHERRLQSEWRTLVFLRGKIRELKPTVVLSFGEYWNSFVLLALLGLRVPVAVSDRCQPDKHLGRGHEFLRRMLYPGAAAVIAQTSVARDLYRSRFRNRNIRVIGNPVLAPPEVPDAREAEYTVLSVGRLIRSKQHHLLIRIFLETAAPQWKLVIVGGDALRQQVRRELEDLIEEKRASGRVILAGARNHMDKYYRNSRIFAFTSHSEGFPNVIGEAQSYGLPVVSFDCVAGPSELVEDGINGYLVPLGDEELFKKRLGELMEDGDLRREMGDRARQSIRSFSMEKIGKEYAALLDSLN